MTLEPHSPEKLDQLALAILDVSATVRQIANTCRENDLPAVALHGRKPLEYLAKLREWADKAAAEMERETRRQRAARLAQEIPPYQAVTTRNSKAASKEK